MVVRPDNFGVNSTSRAFEAILIPKSNYSNPIVVPTICGCAGWSVPKLYGEQFPIMGSHLERYAARFGGVEINSSFYRPHRPQTYARWAASVPAAFRFAVKMPRSITHEQRLQNSAASLKDFLAQVAELGDKLGPVLVQLPPSLRFDEAIATQFFSKLRERCETSVVCEPRHASWFAPGPDALFKHFQVARVAADPAPQAAEPGGWSGLIYHRLHGSPKIYYSAYSPQFLKDLAASLRAAEVQTVPRWCVFDNTAEAAATGNALELMEHLDTKKLD